MADALILSGSAAVLLYSLHLTSIFMSTRFVTRTSGTELSHDGGVTLVRPVCGLDYDAERTLRSSFDQAGVDLEVLFCVADERDRVVPLVLQLIEEHPHVDARLLIGESFISRNPKLNNMAKGWGEARHETVIFADSNLLLTPDYCVRVRDFFLPDTFVVSSPPVGSDPVGFWGEVECAMLNTHAARWQYAAAALELGFAQGKTLAFRKSRSPVNLMRLLGAEPAEDAAATKVARSRGEHVRLVAPPFSHPVGPRSASMVWKRHTRWAKLRRATFPVMFASEILTGIVPAQLAFMCVFWALDLSILPALLLGPLLWYVPEVLMARHLGWTCGLLTPFALLLRDCLTPLFYVSAWASDDFVWNGHKMSGSKPPREAF